MQNQLFALVIPFISTRGMSLTWPQYTTPALPTSSLLPMVYNPRRSERGRPQQSWDRNESTLILHDKRHPSLGYKSRIPECMVQRVPRRSSCDVSGVIAAVHGSGRLWVRETLSFYRVINDHNFLHERVIYHGVPVNRLKE